LRERAEQQLAARFDVRAFHDQVLGEGAVPLEILEQRIKDWVRVQKTPGAP